MKAADPAVDASWQEALAKANEITARHRAVMAEAGLTERQVNVLEGMFAWSMSRVADVLDMAKQVAGHAGAALLTKQMIETLQQAGSVPCHCDACRRAQQ